MSESNTAVGRPLPLWPYSASDNVRRALGLRAGKVAINLSMGLVDFQWRYAHVAAAEMQLRLYQNIAQADAGGGVVGTMAQDRSHRIAAEKPVFAWHAQHEDLYVGQQNAARVLLLATVTRRRIAGSSACSPSSTSPSRWRRTCDGLARSWPVRPRGRAGRDAGGDGRVRPRRMAACWSQARRRRTLPIGSVVRGRRRRRATGGSTIARASSRLRSRSRRLAVRERTTPESFSNTTWRASRRTPPGAGRRPRAGA